MSAQEPRFGTDGVRGVANTELTAELALKLGKAAAFVLGQHLQDRHVIVGRDTRISGDMLESALNAGMASMGALVTNIGVAPTPAVSLITILSGAAAGAVISASHNPYPDNGIKFFGANGQKLSDAVEDEIEAAMAEFESLPRPTGGHIGRITDSHHLIRHYIDRLEEIAGDRLEGLKLVLDCANGAAYEIAPELFREMGAEIIVINADPDGLNINDDCGSTKPDRMRAMVRENGAHAGLAFDGDCDRVMMCDENWDIVDGDKMMAVLALGMKQRGELENDAVVATIMSNAGLEVALERQGIRLIRADVGDRYVAEEMARSGAVIGGEQSGHILLPRVSATGDGMVTGLQVLEEMVHSGRNLSELASAVTHCPQVLRNVRVRSREGWQDVPEIEDAIQKARGRLGKPEWLSVRASGTEPLIRVMAQDPDASKVEAIVNELVTLLQSRFGE